MDTKDAGNRMAQPRAKSGREFDVFFCYNRADVEEVERIAQTLCQNAVRVWLDIWSLRPGLPWHQALDDQIRTAKSAAVFVGRSGIGAWQNRELAAFLYEFVERGCPVIPVVLPSCQGEPQLPRLLSDLTCVDFRTQNPDPITQLLWGISGERGNASCGRGSEVAAKVPAPALRFTA